MLTTTKNLLKGICIITWGIIGLIIGLRVLAISPAVPLALYASVIKYLFWAFWVIVCFSLPFLIYYLKKFAEEKKAEMYARSGTNASDYFKIYFEYFSGEPGSVLLTIIFVPVSLLIIFESFSLIMPVIYMWILIFILALIAILSRITPEDGIIKSYVSFITVLNSIILIFAIFALSDPFHKTFISSTAWIDRVIFASAAEEKGDNPEAIKKQRIDEIDSQKHHPSSTPSYAKTFKKYTMQLKNDELTENLRPGNVRNDGKTIHAVYIKRAFESLQDEKVSRTEKQEIMETSIDYLVILVETGHIKEVKNDNHYPIKPVFLEKLLRVIKNNNMENIASIRERLKKLLKALRKTTINPYILEKFIIKSFSGGPGGRFFKKAPLLGWPRRGPAGGIVKEVKS